MNALLTWLNAKRGRRTELATALGIFPGTITQWGDDVPVHHVPKIVKVTGIPAAKLRPDLAKMFRENAA